jgi:hypothetical protein
LLRTGVIRVMGGGQLTWNHTTARLINLYGENPLAGEVYLRIYPALMKTHKMGNM